MKKTKFSVTHKDEKMVELVAQTNHKAQAIWAIDCAKRVLPFFEKAYPEDPRPRNALKTLQTWINTSQFKMAVIRNASLTAHAAAREVGEDNPARSAARAAGQAVATAHVASHSIEAASYALQAIHRAATPTEAEAAVFQERTYQYQHLLNLKEKSITSVEKNES